MAKESNLKEKIIIGMVSLAIFVLPFVYVRLTHTTPTKAQMLEQLSLLERQADADLLRARAECQASMVEAGNNEELRQINLGICKENLEIAQLARKVTYESTANRRAIILAETGP